MTGCGAAGALDVRGLRTRGDEPAHDEHPDGEHEQRPHQVELLLHPEGPEVQHRARSAVGPEVVGGLAGEAQVGDVDARRHDVAADEGVVDAGDHQPRRHRGDDEDEHGGRQQPPSPPGPEGRERDPAGALHLGEQQAGDEEAGDDEEDVDADEARAGTGSTDGDGTQAFDVGRRGPGG
jgi:hypothetical protein